MVRRLATQVHKQASRLLRADFIKREPAWFQAVLEHPPLPLPARAPPSRTSYDLPFTVEQSAADTKPLPVAYLEDKVRKQFFRDHPFEAFRPRTLVENATIEPEHPTKDVNWIRLRQRGRNPKAEDAIDFALNLHRHHKKPLSEAYPTSVAQFRALRSEHEIATMFATLEAENYGAQFRPTQTEAGFARELSETKTWDVDERYDQSAIAARKRWKAIVERDHPMTEWTGGQKYMKLWKEGVRPDYSPGSTQPVFIAEAGLTSSPEASNVVFEPIINQFQKST